MPPERDPAELGIEALLPVIRRFPQTLAAYQELISERDRQLAEDQRHFSNALAFLRRRRAKPKEVKAMKREHEQNVRDIHEAFQGCVRELVQLLLSQRGSSETL